MEIWFIAAVTGAILAGISNFFFKVAASRGYNAEVFTLYGGLVAAVLTGFVALLFHNSLLQFNLFTALMLTAGMIAALNGIMKVYALRHIDSTIYFPLFKLLAPGLAIIFGVIWFAETFTSIEWLGMLLGLIIPLLLITKAENGRQVNLKAGLVLVLLTALTSASAAALNKFAIDAGVDVLVGLFYASFGVFVGTLITIIFKRGWRSTFRHIQADSDVKLIFYASLRTIFITLGFGLILYAYAHGGTLAIVQTIHSMYILIPIVLSIIFYHEHWNLQKAIAIVLSVGALALLG
jgi:drug/metabolite transporter (DMT)-like permease